MNNQTNHVTDALIQRQILLEQEMRSLGTAKFQKMIADAKSKKRESETPYGSALLHEAVLPMAEKIREYLKASKERGKGKGAPHTAVLYLNLINNPELCAFQTCKTVLDSISLHREPTALALKISGCLEDECRMKVFKKEDKPYYTTLMNNLDSRTKHHGYRKKLLVQCMNKRGIVWGAWDKDDRLHLGARLLELFIETTGFITMELVQESGDKTPYRIEPTPKLIEWISKKNASGEVMQPEYLPMLVPPVPWTKPWSGGYMSRAVAPLPLVKTHSKRYLEDLNRYQIPLVYKALNTLQNTPWQVNQEVLMVFGELWNTGMEVGDTVPRSLIPDPPKPADIETNEVARRKWRLDKMDVRSANIRRSSKVIQIAKTLAIAEKFKDEPEIYFPHQLDFRGRMYPTPLFLNPQGPDYAKALLRFAEAKPLGTQDSADWLAIHGANCYGVDKVSYEDRLAWVRANVSQITQTAENPLDFLWWTKADSPWQFLAFCFEWYGYLNMGLEFASKIPVALDGSCNGLQHFSAMLRDPIGGAAVNLFPSDKPSDIYQVVADKVMASIKDDTSPLGRIWYELEVTRKVTKRCVMTLPYGATQHAFRAFVQEWITENNHKDLFGADFKNYNAAKYLAEKIHTAISGTVVKAVEVMSWLQEVARVASAAGLPLQWTTPAGLPVVQSYLKHKTKQIKMTVSGVKMKPRVLDETAEHPLDARRQVNGVSPNFVHSLDASAAMLTLVSGSEQGISAFCMIHDSYASHAADTSLLAQTLRESFVSMYQDHDVISEFLESVATSNKVSPETFPARTKPAGCDDLSTVLESKYFFA